MYYIRDMPMYIIHGPFYGEYAHVKYTYNIHHFAHADVNYTLIMHVQSYVYHTKACRCIIHGYA